MSIEDRAPIGLAVAALEQCEHFAERYAAYLDTLGETCEVPRDSRCDCDYCGAVRLMAVCRDARDRLAGV